MAASQASSRGQFFATCALLGLGMAVFGSATPVSKLVTEAFPPFVAALLRVVIGAAVLGPVVLYRTSPSGSLAAMSSRDWRWMAVLAAFGMLGFTVLMLYGMRLVPGVVGAIVMSTTPAVTAAAAVLWLGEQLTWRRRTAITLAVGGVLVLHLANTSSVSSGSTANWVAGSLLVFAAVCCEAAYTLVGKRLTERFDPLWIAFLAAVTSIPLFLPVALWQLRDFAIGEVPGTAWLALTWYGAGTLAVGSWLWYAGLARAEGSVAAGFMGVMPVSALLLSYVLLGEPPRWGHLAGFGVVFAGVLLMSWEHVQMARDDKSQ